MTIMKHNFGGKRHDFGPIMEQKWSLRQLNKYDTLENVANNMKQGVCFIISILNITDYGTSLCASQHPSVARDHSSISI